MTAVSHGLHRSNGRILPNLGGESGRDPDGIEIASEFGIIARRFSLDLDSAHGFFESLWLDNGLYLVVTEFDIRDSYRTQVFGEDLIEFHYRISGDCGLVGDWGEIEFSKLSFLCWHQPDGYDDVWETLKGREASVTLYVSPDWLRRGLGPGCGALVPPFLLDAIAEGAPPQLSYRLLPPHPSAAAILDAIRNNNFPGPLRMLHAKAKALELLCVSIDALLRLPPDEPSNHIRLTDRELADIEEAHEILAREFAENPSIARLARRVGLNANKLAFGFKRRYGETTYEFVRRTRLERARELLISTDLQVGQVAGEVGYAHHSTFTAAFTEHFGVSPGALARQRRIYGKVR
ncbi:MAG TPA: AraC family transcriptional regulator [Stellaceae bacterium]|nr:AraC family transcriptional regulator [Stellaceae bacterium]